MTLQSLDNKNIEEFGFIGGFAGIRNMMEKGPRKIGQITYTVSSSWDKGTGNHFTPEINSKQGWSAGANNGSQWINMKFPKRFVTNVLTQGRINGDHGQYVKDFDLYYKDASNKWVNTGRKRAGTNNGIVKIPVNKLTQEIQLNIKSWSRHITMRAGVEFGRQVGSYGRQVGSYGGDVRVAQATQKGWTPPVSKKTNVDNSDSAFGIPGLDSILGPIKDFFTNLINTMKDKIGGTLNKILNIKDTIVEKLGGLFDPLVKKFQGPLRNIMIAGAVLVVVTILGQVIIPVFSYMVPVDCPNCSCPPCPPKLANV
jgi:hypothetical protein